MERKVRDGLEEVETEMEDSRAERGQEMKMKGLSGRTEERERDGGREEENNLPPGSLLSADGRETLHPPKRPLTSLHK